MTEMPVMNHKLHISLVSTIILQFNYKYRYDAWTSNADLLTVTIQTSINHFIL